MNYRNQIALKKRPIIGILVSGLPPTTIGGAEIAAYQIAKCLSTRNLDVHIITRTDVIKIKGKKRTLKRHESVNGFVIHRIPCSKIPILRFITHLLFGIKEVIHLKPDIIHGQQITPNGLIAVLTGLILRKRIVVYARGSEIYNSSQLYLKSIAQFVVSRANVVLGVSEDLTRRMRHLWPQIPIFTLTNGLDVNRYFHDPTPKSAIELIFVGRLVKNKRVLDALKAVAQVKEYSPKITLTIIGSGPEEAFLKAQCNLLNIEDHIRFLGKLSPKKIPKYLSKADIFIFPSLYEGNSLAILEAMASGLPILASRTTGIPELIQEHVNGLLNSPGNIIELAQNLRILIQNEELRIAMGKKSRELAKGFSWKHVVIKLLQYYFNK
jgi:glycosyltransferase involved in cell wall biosynthesis